MGGLVDLYNATSLPCVRNDYVTFAQEDAVYFFDFSTNFNHHNNDSFIICICLANLFWNRNNLIGLCFCSNLIS